MLLRELWHSLGWGHLPASTFTTLLLLIADLSWISGLVVLVRMYLKYQGQFSRPEYILFKGGAAFNRGAYGEAKKFFLQAGAFAQAALSAKKHGSLSEAITLAKKAGDTQVLAQLYFENKDFALAAEVYERLKMWLEAAKCFEMAAKSELALTCYRKANRPDDELRLLREMRNYTALAEKLSIKLEQHWSNSKLSLNKELIQKLAAETASAYMSAGNYKLASEIFMKAGLTAQAAECLEHDEQWIAASELYRQSGLLGKAADLLIRAGRFEQAAEIYEDLKRPRDAALALKMGGQNTRAHFLEAEMAVQFKDDEAAAENFIKSRAYAQAATVLAKMGRWSEAAEAWIKNQDLLKAADAYERGKDDQKAARIWKQANQFENAALAFMRCGLKSEAAECFVKAKKYLQAGKILETLNVQAAIELYQRVPSDAEDHWKVRHQLARLLLSKGYKDLSKQILKETCASISYERETLTVFYDLARYLEIDGQLKDALPIYDRILQIDLKFKDALARKQSLDQKFKVSET